MPQIPTPAVISFQIAFQFKRINISFFNRASRLQSLNRHPAYDDQIGFICQCGDANAH